LTLSLYVVKIVRMNEELRESIAIFSFSIFFVLIREEL